MSKKNIEKYIAIVMSVLKEKYPNEEIPSSYNGYISSFGAGVIQSGLKPTLAVFENKSASTDEDKSMLTELILNILGQSGENVQASTLLEHVLQSKNETLLKQKILDIAVAIKLSIRTFKLV